jgi:hypothetical protein
MRTLAYVGLAALAIAVCPALAQQPSQAELNAIRQNCRGDYPTVCAGVPTGGKAALQCLQRNAGSVSAACRQSLAALGGGAVNSTPGTVSPGAPQTQQPPTSRRQEAAMLRTSCRGDYRAFCSDVEPGAGRGLACLKAHGPELSPACRSALLSLRGDQ